MRPEDSDYYRARAIEERWLMSDAAEPRIAYIHAHLAAEYEALANRLDLGDRIEGKRIEAACNRIP